MHLNWPEPSDFPTLFGDAVHVWAVPLDRSRASSRELDDVLAPDERARADGFVLDKPRHEFVATRAALRTLLGRYLKLAPGTVPIVVDPNGRPRLAAADLRFNVAHSGDLALIAVTRGGEVGVDVELLRPVDRAQEIAARNFHPAEQAAIRTASVAELPTAFMRLWTRKEAVLKALGAGLGYPLDAFCVPLDEHAHDWVDVPARLSFAAARYWLESVDPCTGYVAAVAATARTQPPMGFTYSH